LAAELVVRALGDEDWRVRKEAVTVAASLDRRDEVLRGLEAALDDRSNIGLRNSAVEAMIAIGPDAVPSAIAAVRGLDADGRKLAVEALGGIPDERSAAVLVGALGDDDRNVRYAAAESLGAAAVTSDIARDAACSALAAHLAGSDPQMALASLGALVRLEAPLRFATLKPLLSEPLLRSLVLHALGRCPETEAAEELVRASTHASSAGLDAALRALAAWILAAQVAGRELRPVREALRAEPSAQARISAAFEEGTARADALLVGALLGGDAEVERLLTALSDPDLSSHAEGAVSLLGQDATRALLLRLTSLPAHKRAELLFVVAGHVEALDADALGVVRREIEGGSEGAAAAALHLLALHGDASDLQRAIALVTAPDPRVAAAASAALLSLAGRFPKEARAALQATPADGPMGTAASVLLLGLVRAKDRADDDVELLRRALGSGTAKGRRAAVEALAEYGGAAAMELVAMVLADEEREVRLAAVRALGVLRHADALEALLGSVSDLETVAAACRALGAADPDRCLAVARRLVRSPDASIACAAVEAAGPLDGLRREDVLLAALEHQDAEVVKLALSELHRTTDARSLARLGLCLDHESWEVRRLAAELLGAQRTLPAQALLRARLERESDGSVREALVSSLGHHPPEAEGN
jgi:HEAT repeat protein